MTNKEAIGHLETIFIYSENDGYTDKAREALKMAIEALNETSEPKGKWILWEDCEGKTRTCTCPICGDTTRCWHAPNYCSNCGVRLEVEE